MSDVLSVLGCIELLLQKHKILGGPFVQRRERYKSDSFTFWTELSSNAWWGGAGSYADIIFDKQPGISSQEAWEDTRVYRRALIDLAMYIDEAGHMNPRIQFIVDTFREWERQGIYEKFQRSD